jgi:hypothetical protein
MVDVRYAVHPAAVEALRLRLSAGASARGRRRWRVALVGARPGVLLVAALLLLLIAALLLLVAALLLLVAALLIAALLRPLGGQWERS